MLTKWLTLGASLILIGSAAVLAPSADKPAAIPEYKLVPDWPKLPEGAKFGGITAVATDAADNVYVFHRGKQPVMVFDRDGKFLRSFADGTVKTAHGLRLDKDGNVWITDIGHHLVTKFDAQGKPLLTVGKKDEPGETKEQFNKPADVAVAPNGDFYVADGYGNSRVVKFAKDGKYLKEWGKKGTAEGEFNLPHAILLDSKGRVYVGDRENNRVQIFDADGKFLSQWKDSGAPFGLFLVGDEKMMVADGRGNRVNVLDIMGKELGHWGEKGTGAGQFTLPHGICVDARGAVYVAEVTGMRVQKFVRK